MPSWPTTPGRRRRRIPACPAGPCRRPRPGRRGRCGPPWRRGRSGAAPVRRTRCAATSRPSGPCRRPGQGIEYGTEELPAPPGLPSAELVGEPRQRGLEDLLVEDVEQPPRASAVVLVAEEVPGVLHEFVQRDAAATSATRPREPECRFTSRGMKRTRSAHRSGGRSRWCRCCPNRRRRPGGAERARTKRRDQPRPQLRLRSRLPGPCRAECKPRSASVRGHERGRGQWEAVKPDEAGRLSEIHSEYAGNPRKQRGTRGTREIAPSGRSSPTASCGRCSPTWPAEAPCSTSDAGRAGPFGCSRPGA